jgi:uncharacterized membrane protein YkvA (DUF1232 family)
MSASELSDSGFWDGVAKVVRKAGRALLLSAFELKVTATSEQTPAWAKTLAVGALGYLFLPVDAVPDFAPFVGFTDDLFAMSTAITSIGRFVTREIKAQAAAELDEFLR